MSPIQPGKAVFQRVEESWIEWYVVDLIWSERGVSAVLDRGDARATVDADEIADAVERDGSAWVPAMYEGEDDDGVRWIPHPRRSNLETVETSDDVEFRVAPSSPKELTFERISGRGSRTEVNAFLDGAGDGLVFHELGGVSSWKAAFVSRYRGAIVSAVVVHTYHPTQNGEELVVTRLANHTAAPANTSSWVLSRVRRWSERVGYERLASYAGVGGNAGTCYKAAGFERDGEPIETEGKDWSGDGEAWIRQKWTYELDPDAYEGWSEEEATESIEIQSDPEPEPEVEEISASTSSSSTSEPVLVADGGVEIPPEYRREIEERERILEACPIDVYSASINPRWGHSHKLMSYYEARPGVSESARMVMIDSGYSRVGSMEGVLEAARKVDADAIVPPDLTPACDGYEDRDPEAHAREIAGYYDDFLRADLDVKLYLPIHPPISRYLEELRRYEPGYVLGLEDNPAFDMRRLTLDLVELADGIAIGGLRGLDVDERIEALRTARERVPCKRIHALAPGTEPAILRELRNNPGLVDSIDVSTPETAPANGKVPDKSWKQHKHLMPRGTDSTTIRGSWSSSIALQLAYMLSPLCSDPILEAAEVSDGSAPVSAD